MPDLEIDGIGIIEVDDSFLSMTPEEQAVAVDEIGGMLRQPEAVEPPTGPVQADVAATGPDDEIVQRGMLLPLGKTERGEVTLALPEILEGPRQTIVDLAEGRRQPEEITGKEIFELGGLFAGGGIAGRTAKAAPALQRGPTSEEVIAAGSRLDVAIPRAVSTDTLATQQLGKTLANVPGGGTPLRKASTETIERLGVAAGRAEEVLGQGDIPIAGERLRAGIETQITEKSAARVKARYDRVDALVDPDVRAPLTETAKIAGEILARREEAAIAEPSGAVARIQAAIDRPEGLTYQGTKDLRTFIGQLLDNRTALPVDMSEAELRQIYGSLSKDLRNVVQAAGDLPARTAFERANKFAARQATLNKELNTVLKAKTNEAVFDKLLAAAGSTSRADIALLRKARGAVDATTWQELGSAVISRLGRDTAGNFSPDRFVTAWGKLSTEGKRVLYRTTNKKGIANVLDDIATVSSRIKSLNQFANPSGTGQTLLTGAIGAGAYADPLATLTTVLGARVAAEALSRPSSAGPIAKWLRTVNRTVAKRSSRTAIDALERGTRVLAIELADDLGEEGIAPRIIEGFGGQLQEVPPSGIGLDPDVL